MTFPTLLSLFLTASVQAQSKEQYQSPKQIAGTIARTETEFKFAVYIPKDHRVGTLVSNINRSLNLLTQTDKMKFARFMKKPYSIQADFKDFVFDDRYLDTQNLELAKSGISYRVRRRFHSTLDLLKNSFLGSTIYTRPVRQEIQLKKDYQKIQNNLTSVQESRFEFRLESPPFLDGEPLPNPLQVDSLLKFARQGYFRHFYLQPSIDLQKTLSLPKGKMPNLTKSTRIMTLRKRNHLSLPHPWGSGPNPEQIFIISVDWIHLANSKKYDFLEVEIEFERNTSDTLFQLAQTENMLSGLESELLDASLQKAHKALNALRYDHRMLATLIRKILVNTINQPILPPMSKYQRIALKKNSAESLERKSAL